MEHIKTDDEITSELLLKIDTRLQEYYGQENVDRMFQREILQKIVETIVGITRFYKIDPKKVITKTKFTEYVFVRNIITLDLLRQKQIKTHIGIFLLRNHATVIYSIRNHLNLVETKNEAYTAYVEKYNQYLLSKGLRGIRIFDKPSERLIFKN